MYSDMWNMCIICNSKLDSPDFISKIFSQNRQNASYLFPVIERSIENTDVLFLYLDMDLKLIMCNNAIEHITGYTRKEVFRGDWLQLLFGKNRPKRDIFRAMLTSCFSNPKSRAYEGSIIKKDGTERVLLWQNTAISNTTEEPWGLFCTAHDITEHKLTDSDVVACSESLRDILSSIKDYALITTNLNDKITYYSEEAANIFRWQKDMTLDDVNTIFDSKDAQGVINDIKFAINKTGIYKNEFNFLRKNSEEFPGSITVSSLLSATSKSIGYVYIIKDIGESKRIEARMMQNEKMAAIGQLAAGVAHEINNPLLVILGRLDMLKIAEENINPEIKKTFDIVKSQAKRMRLITDRLLFYSRKKPVYMDMVDVNDILKTISPLLAYYPEFQKIVWKEEFQDNLPKVKGDFNQLQEVFLNISINACQAISQGGMITISSHLKGNIVEVWVKDTGDGITKNNLEKLFLPFFTTKDKGTGLGLALCHSIIRSHEGTIDVESAIGKGSIFKVGLPVAEDKAV
jgi:PAS domain S-box-containing protein